MDESHDRAPPQRRLLAAVREALRGSHLDYTTGSIPRAILLLAVPMVIEMAMESLFALTDAIWVARLRQPSALAVIGFTEALLALVYALAMGLSMSATATVARRIGEKDRDGAARYAVQAIALGVVLAVPLGLLGGLFANRLITLLGAQRDVVEQCGGYARVMLGGNAVILLLFLVNAVFRGAGDAVVPMRTLWIANGINLVLDPCLIYGIGPFPRLGVLGAAIATTTGRAIGVLYLFRQLARGARHLEIRREHLEFSPAKMVTLLRLSGAGIVQGLVQTTSWVGVTKVLGFFPTAVVAGYTAGIRMVIFALLPSWGMSNAAATMVGQSLGAGRPDRAAKAVWLAGLYNMVFLGVVGAAFVFAAPTLVRVFGTEPEVAEHAVACLRIVSSGFLFYAYGMVFAQAFNGAGDPWTPTWINGLCFWGFQLPLAWFLALKLGLGPHAVFAAVAAAFSLFAVVAAVVFRRGRWRTKRV
jgi:putative MATE family efflux protein